MKQSFAQRQSIVNSWKGSLDSPYTFSGVDIGNALSNFALFPPLFFSLSTCIFYAAIFPFAYDMLTAEGSTM